MIVSHKWRFVFIKTRRSAGSSIEASLSRILGPDDIITGSPRDGIERRNCAARLTGHIGWRQIVGLIGARAFWSYRRFCVERNSWDKALSDWRWHREVLADTSLDLTDFTLALRRSDWPRYARGAAPVAEVWPFEGLDLARRFAGLGLPPVALPRLKESPDVGAHCARSRAAVAEVFAREIRHFNFSSGAP